MKPKFKIKLSLLAKFLLHLSSLEKLYLRILFKMKVGYSLNLENPTTLNEVLQHIKLYDREKIYTSLADKVEVRNVVSELIGAQYLIPLYHFGEDPNEIERINFNHFGNVIIKVNHDCSGGIVFKGNFENVYSIKSGYQLVGSGREKIVNFIKERFSYNHFYITREWQYLNIKKKFLIEKLLLSSEGKVPNDYKFHCFNGVVEFVYVSNDREGLNTRKIYYKDWTEAPFTWCKKGDEYKFEGKEVAKPVALNEMIFLAERIAKKFRYIRVDFYELDGKVFFGELTLQQGSGFEPILPRVYDVFYGEKLLARK